MGGSLLREPQPSSQLQFESGSEAQGPARSGPEALLVSQDEDLEENTQEVQLAVDRVSVKMHGVTPDMLPLDLRRRLTKWIASAGSDILQVDQGGLNAKKGWEGKG